MSETRDKIEGFFSSIGRGCYQHPIKTLAITFFLIGILICQIPKIILDVSAEALLHKNDPARLQYNDFRDQFGRAELIVIAIKSSNVFETDFLIKLKSLHEDLEKEVPYLKEVSSLINARETRGEGDTLIVGELLEGWPEKKVDLDTLKKRALENPFYRNVLISEDGSLATLIIETDAIIDASRDPEDLFSEFDDESITDKGATDEKNSKRSYFSEKENTEVVAAVHRVVNRYKSDNFPIAIAGDPVVMDIYNRTMNRDILIVVTLSLITVAIFLAIFFRRFSGVLLPEIVIISALFSTAGLFALLDTSIKITSMVLPAFLLAVSVGDAIHVLVIFYRSFQEGSSKEDAIAHAIGHSGLAIVLTSLTTAAGLLSFSVAELKSIVDIGVFGALGVILALFYTIVMLPALIAVLPIKRKPIAKEKKKSAAMDRVLLFLADFSGSHPAKIVTVCFVIFAISFYCLFKLQYSHNVINWLSDKETVTTDVPFIDKELNGSITIEVVIDSGIENGFHDPELLNRIENLTSDIKKINNAHIYVGKTLTLNDIIKETNQALHENDPEFYTIPADRITIAQELLLFENSGSDDLEKIVDSQFSKTRFTIKTPWVDAVFINDFIKEVKALFQEEFQEKADINITGVSALMARSIPAAIQSMATSYAIAFIVITLMMIFLVGDKRIGLLCMSANLLPIFMIMGIMGVLDIRLDMSTIMIGSMAIGVIVDDTVHFIYNFRKYYERTGNVHQAIRDTLLGTGRALLLTSLILCNGFFILIVSSLSLLSVFGMLTGVTIIFALLADLILAPALIVLVNRNEIQKEK